MKATTQTWFQRIAALAGIMLPLLTYLTATSTWIRVTAAFVASLVLLIWIASELWPYLVATYAARRQSTLSTSETARLRELLAPLDLLSYSYCQGPFHAWHEMSNDTSYIRRMNYGYHGAVHTWLLDLRDTAAKESRVSVHLAVSVSKAVAECHRLVEKVSDDVTDYLLHATLDPSTKLRVKQDWGSARENFNSWIRDCTKLFSELNRTRNARCVTYFSTIPPHES